MERRQSEGLSTKRLCNLHTFAWRPKPVNDRQCVFLVRGIAGQDPLEMRLTTSSLRSTSDRTVPPGRFGGFLVGPAGAFPRSTTGRPTILMLVDGLQ